MTSGPILGKLLAFSLPLMLTGILQLLYNAADMIVVGKYDGKEALAAVGSTAPIINLMVNLFVGLSVGASVLVAQEFGGHREDEVKRTVHTAMSLSVICGAAVCLVGVLAAEPMLTAMDAPTDVLGLSVLYLRIYFLSMPATTVYNYGASIMRGLGDTRRPLLFLTVSGLINVALNIVLVKYFHLGVAGVAIATAASQIVAAVLVVVSLMRADDCSRLSLKQLRISWRKLRDILRIGLPAGLQGAMFSLSNIVIQSNINSFGSSAMAGSSAAGSIEGFVYTGMNSVAQGSLTFTGQNYGAGKYKRIRKVLSAGLLLAGAVGVVFGLVAYAFGEPLLGIYSSAADPAEKAEVIQMGLIRMQVICTTYFLCGVMDVLAGTLRGMGHSILPMLVTLAGVCGLRIVWIDTAFRLRSTLHVLFLSYPVSWFITALALLLCVIIVYCRVIRRQRAQVTGKNTE